MQYMVRNFTGESMIVRVPLPQPLRVRVPLPTSASVIFPQINDCAVVQRLHTCYGRNTIERPLNLAHFEAESLFRQRMRTANHNPVDAQTLVSTTMRTIKLLQESYHNYYKKFMERFILRFR